MAGETRLEWLSVLRSVLSSCASQSRPRNEAVQNRLQSSLSPTPVLWYSSGSHFCHRPSDEESDRDKPLAWFWGWRVGVGLLGVRCLQRPHRSHPGWAAESCSDFSIYCCRMRGNCGCSAVSTRQFFGTALRSQQHGVCRTMEYITSK
jgi:hypothetical protein